MMKRPSGKRKQHHCCLYCSSENMMSISPSPDRRDLIRTHRTLNTTSCSHRAAFVWPSGKLLDENHNFRLPSCMGSAAIVCGSATVVCMTVCRHRICVCYWLVIDQIRGHLSTKFKISYSCVHLLPNSGQCNKRG